LTVNSILDTGGATQIDDATVFEEITALDAITIAGKGSVSDVLFKE
jgi:hypothetical protein